jgi:hypothetical protein
MYAVVVDKIEAAADRNISYEIGMRLPLSWEAAGKALLCQLSDAELAQICRGAIALVFCFLNTVSPAPGTVSVETLDPWVPLLDEPAVPLENSVSKLAVAPEYVLE